MRRIEVEGPFRTKAGPIDLEVLLSDIPETAPPAVREGLARWNVVLSGGRCPCGTSIIGSAIESLREGRGNSGRVEVWHEVACPAVPNTLRRAINEWLADE